MALTENTRQYEFLVRVHADGSMGAHSQTITEILRDGELVSSMINPPEPLPDDRLEQIVQLIEGWQE